MPTSATLPTARRHGLRILATAVAAVAVAAVLPAPASAHETIVFHGLGSGADMARVTNWTRVHERIEVADRECDGHSVYVRYRLSTGSLETVGDGDGCGARLAWEHAPLGTSIVRYQICEVTMGCSPIRRT